MKIGAEQLPKPFFYDRFSIAAGDADHWNPEFGAVVLRQQLQGLQRVFYQQDIALPILASG